MKKGLLIIATFFFLWLSGGCASVKPSVDDLYSYIKPQVERIARKQYNNEQTSQLIEPKKN